MKTHDVVVFCTSVLAYAAQSLAKAGELPEQARQKLRECVDQLAKANEEEYVRLRIIAEAMQLRTLKYPHLKTSDVDLVANSGIESLDDDKLIGAVLSTNFWDALRKKLASATPAVVVTEESPTPPATAE